MKHCPNCGSVDVKPAGENKIYCPVCDITFTITADGARPEQTDVIKGFHNRLDQQDAEIEKLKPQNKSAKPDNDQEPEPSSDELEEEKDPYDYD